MLGTFGQTQHGGHGGRCCVVPAARRWEGAPRITPRTRKGDRLSSCLVWCLAIGWCFVAPKMAWGIRTKTRESLPARNEKVHLDWVLRQQGKGGRGLPHSKTLRDQEARSSVRQVLQGHPSTRIGFFGSERLSQSPMPLPIMPLPSSSQPQDSHKTKSLRSLRAFSSIVVRSAQRGEV